MISRFALTKIAGSKLPGIENTRAFVAAGGKFFKLNDNSHSTKHYTELPSNMEEVNAAEKSTTLSNRARETSGQQTSGIFSGGFMTGQFDQDTVNENIGDKSDTQGYDMVGGAKLNSVLENHVPEPFSANDEGDNLKEGIPEGLSEMGGQQRWTMEDRMEHSHYLEH